MDAVDPNLQQALQPFRPLTRAEREAMAASQARLKAENERREHRALQDQQQHLANIGELS
ncbi:hypothetical protein LJR074_001941 [Acidovorax sp. LjRoot74]|uniref:hypothetical protein n=1 Tax=Acidovorax sp. LjRoot74 TaxID=3342337 RepID=UPI003ED0932D